MRGSHRHGRACPGQAFGKHRGISVEAVARKDPDYLKWMLEQDFGDDAKVIVREALAAR